MSSTTRIRVARLEEGDAAALAAFYGEAWGANVSAESIDTVRRALVASHPFANEAGALTVGVFLGEKIIGHLGTIAAEFWDGARAVPAFWLKGFMVLEHYRNGPVGFMLIKETSRHLGLAAVMTVAEPARRLMQAIGFKDIGVVSNYLSIIRPRRLLATLDPVRLGLEASSSARRRAVKALQWGPIGWGVSAIATVGLWLLDAANRLRAVGFETTITPTLPAAAELDTLWAGLRDHVGFAQTRTGAYIEWRYGQRAAADYEFIAARKAGQLAALAVVRAPRRDDDPRLGGLRVGLIVDLVIVPDETRALTCVLRAARAWAKSRGFDAVLLTISHAALRARLLRAGYVRVPGNVHFMLRVGDSGVPVLAGLRDTWLTRGDAWGDDI